MLPPSPPAPAYLQVPTCYYTARYWSSSGTRAIPLDFYVAKKLLRTLLDPRLQREANTLMLLPLYAKKKNSLLPIFFVDYEIFFRVFAHFPDFPSFPADWFRSFDIFPITMNNEVWLLTTDNCSQPPH